MNEETQSERAAERAERAAERAERAAERTEAAEKTIHRELDREHRRELSEGAELPGDNVKKNKRPETGG